MIENMAIYILSITFIVMLYISWINYRIYIVSKKLLGINEYILDITISLNNKTASLKEETIDIRKISQRLAEKI